MILKAILPTILLLLLASAPALADCQAVTDQAFALDKDIKGQSEQCNAQLQRILTARDTFMSLDKQLQQAGSDAERLGILDSMEQQLHEVLQTAEARQPCVEGLMHDREKLLGMVRQAVSEGCLKEGAQQQISAALDNDRNVVAVNQRFMADSKTLLARANDLRAKISGGAQPASTEKTPPTIRIINNAGMDICVHPSGMSGGSCFGAGQERVYKLDKLYGWDTDSGQKYKTNQIVIIGGGGWRGSPYTSYQDMTLCLERVFTHDSGEVVWRVTGGLEENCGVRGYHQ